MEQRGISLIPFLKESSMHPPTEKRSLCDHLSLCGGEWKEATNGKPLTEAVKPQNQKYAVLHELPQQSAVSSAVEIVKNFRTRQSYNRQVFNFKFHQARKT